MRWEGAGMETRPGEKRKGSGGEGGWGRDMARWTEVEGGVEATLISISPPNPGLPAQRDDMVSVVVASSL